MVNWITVKNRHPEPHGDTYLVYRPSTGVMFQAKVCYGMHHPWWVPRNGYTVHESEPIDFHDDDMWAIILPPVVQKTIEHHSV